MKERSFHDRIHTIGRLTVICALVSFMAVPFVLAMVNHIPMNIPQILQNAFPILLTFSISGICENLSFMPIIGSGALYMACVTGNVSNMKVPAAVNAMEVAGHAPGSEKADVVAMIAVAASTFVTTAYRIFRNAVPGSDFCAGVQQSVFTARIPEHGACPHRRPVIPIYLKGAEAGHRTHYPAGDPDLCGGKELFLQQPELHYGGSDRTFSAVFLWAV